MPYNILFLEDGKPQVDQSKKKTEGSNPIFNEAANFLDPPNTSKSNFINYFFRKPCRVSIFGQKTQKGRNLILLEIIFFIGGTSFAVEY